MSTAADNKVLALLKKIDKRRGKIRIFPEERDLLNECDSLDLSDRAIDKIPKSIEELKNLEMLNLSNNEISIIPNSLCVLKKLRELDLSHNQLKRVPTAISYLDNLVILDLRDNGLTRLPSRLKDLKKLEYLFLEGNNITNLDAILSEMPQIKVDIGLDRETFNQLMNDYKKVEQDIVELEDNLGLKVTLYKYATIKVEQGRRIREHIAQFTNVLERIAYAKAEMEHLRLIEEVNKQKILASSIMEDIPNQNSIIHTQNILKEKNLIPESFDGDHNVILVKKGNTQDGEQPVLTYMDYQTGKTTDRIFAMDDESLESTVFWDADVTEYEEDQWFACELDTMTDEDIMDHMTDFNLPYMPIKIKKAHPLSNMNDFEVKAMIMSYKVGNEYVDAIIRHNPVIFHGAPGTGKTYSVRKIAECFADDPDEYTFVQFHPSYDYSDFVEGLRPVCLVGKDDPTFVRMDGIFKSFCRKIVNANNPDKKYFFIVDEINRADLSRVFGELMYGLETSYRGKGYRFHTQYENLVTHQIIREGDSGADKENIGKAKPLENDCFKNGFYIPENLIFIGIMNDIDRSVESFDFALRRRFHWVEIKANDIMERMFTNMYEDSDMSSEEIQHLAKRVIRMNQALTSSGGSRFGLTDAYHIGPAYFKNIRSFGSDIDLALTEIFEHNITPLIKEYTRGRSRMDIDRLLLECASELEIPYGEEDNE